jgi:VanZ family protein
MTAGLHVAAICALALIFILVEPPDRTLLWDTIFDLGHSLLFGLVMWLTIRVAASLLNQPVRDARVLAVAFAVTVIGAAASELFQLLQPSRNASLADFARDIAGAIAAVLLDRARHEAAPGARVLMRVLATVLIAGILAQLILVIDVYRQRAAAFPTLGRFDGSRWERALLSTRNATVSLTPTGSVASLLPGSTAGVSIDEPIPDWRSYRTLVINLRSRAPGSLPLTVRVYDRQYRGGDHNAFQQIVALTGSPQRIEIPLTAIESGPRSRKLDLQHVRGVSLFIWRLDRPVEIEIGPVLLE